MERRLHPSSMDRETMQRRQHLLVATLAVAGIVVAAVALTSFFENVCRLRFAENLVLREKPRGESAWEILETTSGRLIRMKHGVFAGWYLAVDDLVNFTEAPAAFPALTIRPLTPASAHVRGLILRDRKGAGCYWNLTETKAGVRIQPAGGRYAGWFLDFQEDYVPDIGSDPRTAWNLILTREPLAGSEWKLTRGAQGCLIQASYGRSFQGWYLDCLHEANILETNRCWGESKTRDGPAPPLAR